MAFIKNRIEIQDANDYDNKAADVLAGTFMPGKDNKIVIIDMNKNKNKMNIALNKADVEKLIGWLNSTLPLME